MKGQKSVRVRVTAGARREALKEVGADKLDIAVKEKAERGEANERVRTLVARHYGVAVKSVRIITGHERKNKTISVV